ncbi:hypothetical protein [Tabrizicola sp.]|uniref:hypothetical protein n=1 Tax=Tabrizicola sp. TaxID=2005166 RepID=UPI0026068F09|nr:hypothetical protein [Tabrizicola sp.]MDM7930480.1 hypothetical protein [Tabrizicola sp.]
MTPALASPRTNLPSLRRMGSDAPAFTVLAMLLALGLVPLYAAMALDTRVFQGESPWMKPVKFHYALVFYTVSLAFFARFMPEATRQGRPWRWFSAAVVAAIAAEVIWLAGAAMLNTASHFNTEEPFLAAIYPLMGIIAVLLTSASLVMGISVWRNRSTGLAPALHLAVALGLVLTFLLTVPVAGHLAGAGGHFVGNSTRELWLLGWSRDAGDLRVAHFLATHALHFIPVAGLVAVWAIPAQASRAVWLAAALFVALVGLTFVQALQGWPFLPFLPFLG